jgi:hypothetical protein
MLIPIHVHFRYLLCFCSFRAIFEQTKGYIDDERDDERDENVAYAKQINLTPKSKTQKEMRELRLEENLIGTRYFPFLCLFFLAKFSYYSPFQGSFY